MTIWNPTLDEDDGSPRYLAIVEALDRDIASGRLPEGERLPTHRELAARLGVAIGTVTRAYAAAELRGLIRGERGRGTFVGRHVSTNLPVGDSGERMPPGINLGMTWPLDQENPDLSVALRRISRQRDLSRLLEYQPNGGMGNHRLAGVQWLKRHGVSVDPDRVLVCSGSQHAMLVAIATLARPGETILTEELTYPGLRAVADFLGLKVVGLPTDAQGIDPGGFEAACKAHRPRALYWVPSIQNPTATTASPMRRREIAAIAETHGVPLVEDGIHHLLLDRAESLAWTGNPERDFYIASPSKVVCGGLRVAYLTAPRSLIGDLSQRIWATNWVVSPLAAEVMTQWILDGTAEETLERKRREARNRVDLAHQFLSAEVLRTSPNGYHGWLNLPDHWEHADQFAGQLRQRGVNVTSPEPFYVGSNVAPKAVRLSFSGARTRDELAEGLGLVASILDQQPALGPAIV